MGLDMYLRGKRYMSSHFDKEDAPKMEAIQGMFPELASLRGRFGDNSIIQEVVIDAGYWRKANAIHDWFVKNCQDGEDDCGSYHVSRDALKALRELCEAVIASPEKASELLPTASGFFFGSTDYDDYYMDDLRSTIEIIDRAVALPAQWDLEYHSSW